jgi:hypothetical protein
MATKFFDIVGFKGVSLIDNALAFGHKSALDLVGATHNDFTFTPSSLSYNTAAWSTVAHVVVGINTLLKDLNDKGIITKA